MNSNSVFVLQYLVEHGESTIYEIVLGMNSTYDFVRDALDDLELDGMVANTVKNDRIVYYVG